MEGLKLPNHFAITPIWLQILLTHKSSLPFDDYAARSLKKKKKSKQEMKSSKLGQLLSSIRRRIVFLIGEER